MYELTGTPRVARPVVVIALDGWIDAGLGAAGALASFLDGAETEVIARFDTDALVDYRARRPVARITDGVINAVFWPDIEARVDPARPELVFLLGPEPDMQWRAFAGSVAQLAEEIRARMVLLLGAFPAPVPHTRAVRLASTSTDSELAAHIGYVPGTIDVPAGIGAAIEMAMASTGIPTTGVWARVPHYAAAMPYPAASAALMRAVAELTGIDVDTSELDDAAASTNTRIDELIANSNEHQMLVSQLEQQSDAETSAEEELSNLPSGDEIAAELERFLREQS